MNIDTVTGLVDNTIFIPSPNYAARPEATAIDLLVIHNISLPPGEFGGPYIQDLFTNTLDPVAHLEFQNLADFRVSSHLLIARDGNVTQFVPLTQAAWHAGESSFQGRERCNEFSIGIELEGTDTYPYEPEQYQVLAKLTLALMATYPDITNDRIVGHSDIAPGRKTDPGPSFNWDYFFSLLAEKND